MTERWRTPGLVIRLLLVSCALGAAPPKPPAAAADPVEAWTPASELSRPLVDAETLRRRWIAADLPGIDRSMVVTAAGVVRDRKNAPTGATRTPVRALRCNASSAPLKLDLGSLGISTYVIRVVAMVPTAQLERWRRPLYLELAIENAGGGPPLLYRQRVPYWDDFYAVGEIYLNVDVPRHYTATLKVGDGSEVDAYVYSIELHDVLAGLAPAALKTRPGTYTDEERARLRASTDPAELQAQLNKEVALDNYLAGTEELTPTARRERDDELWSAVLPLNTQYLAEYDEGWLANAMAPGETSAKEAVARYGAWSIAPRMNAFRTAWRSRFLLQNDKLAARYSLDDLANYRALPDPYPYKDRGAGVYFPATGGMAHPQQWLPIAAAVGWWWEGSRLALAPYHDTNVEHRLPYLYLATGNQHAARDAAFMLARWAYLYPGLSDAQMLGFAVVAPGLPYDRDMRLRWRRFGYQRSANLMLGLLYSYDQLFDYIKGNQELARAVSRYIPWIKTDVDLRRMIETRLVGFAAKQILRWHIWDDTETPTWLMLAATIEQAPSVSRPWLQDLWRKTWVYPYSATALPDLLSTTTQRDGTTGIGSVSYARAGSPFALLVDLSHRYVANGGDARFDLTDRRLYGKLANAALFPLTSTVAGGYALTIGDVGGPDEPRVLDDVDALAATWRRGWTWAHDPRLAWIVEKYLGRTVESDGEWRAITEAARTYGRNPFLSQASRVLASWAGILEAGDASDDYRFKRSVYMRVGTGQGHDHADALDLQIVAHGVRLAGDLGERPGYRQPDAADTMLHDRIEVDDKDNPRQGLWKGPSWITTFAPLPEAQYMEGRSSPGSEHPSTRSYRRAVALIDASPGVAVAAPFTGLYRGGQTKHAAGITEPDSYVVDIQRIDGGRWPTWCFHGPWSDAFEVNLEQRHVVGNTPSDTSQEAAYLHKFLDGDDLKYAGAAPTSAPLIATWRLRRTERPIAGVASGKPVTLAQRNAEKRMLGVDYDDRAPAKFLRTYLLGHGGDQVLVGHPTPTAPGRDTATWPFLFVRRAGDVPPGSVYAAVHEPYAGTPFLLDVRQLHVAGATSGVDEPVALAVTTVQGHRDWILSDGNPCAVRHAGDADAQASFGYRSDDALGLRLLELVEGRLYRAKDLTIEVDTASHITTIAKVDYLDRTIWVHTDVPPELWDQRRIQIGEAQQEETFTVSAAVRDRGLVKLTLAEPMDVSYAHIVKIDPVHQEVITEIGPTDLERDPRVSGLTVTDEAMHRSWRLANAGTHPGGHYTYTVADRVDAGALPEGSTLRLWLVGTGQRVRLPSTVQLRRLGTSPGGDFELLANTGVTIRSPSGQALRVEPAQLAAQRGRLVIKIP